MIPGECKEIQSQMQHMKILTIYPIWFVCRFPQEKLIVHDTAILGRPNLVKLVVEKVRECQAEMVIVTSNPAGSKTVVDGCHAAGIPAYGPIWDS